MNWRYVDTFDTNREARRIAKALQKDKDVARARIDPCFYGGYNVHVQYKTR